MSNLCSRAASTGRGCLLRSAEPRSRGRGSPLRLGGKRRPSFSDNQLLYSLGCREGVFSETYLQDLALSRPTGSDCCYNYLCGPCARAPFLVIVGEQARYYAPASHGSGA